MANDTLEPLRGCLDQWRQDNHRYQEDLDESFAALEAFERHLTDWQAQLAGQQEDLANQQQEIDDARVTLCAVDNDLSDRNRDLERDLDAARRKAADLEETLEKSESSRVLHDSEKAQFAIELDQSRRQQKELQQQLEAKRQEMSQQNQRWSEEFARVVEKLEKQAINAALAVTPRTAPAAPAPSPSPAAPQSADDPVLGSVVAQFGKLRKQRAERGSR